jgi:hypothetical protein
MPERGQAAVELLGAAVVLFAGGLLGLQLLGAGHGAVLADHAAQAAAVALVNGKDPERAARAAVPGWPPHALRVVRRGEEVTVMLRSSSPLRVLRGRLSFKSSARLPGAAPP